MPSVNDIKNSMKNHYNSLKSKNMPEALYELVDGIVDAILESAAIYIVHLTKKNEELERKIIEIEKKDKHKN